jgi:methionyl-tRNA synthetase
LPHLGNFVGSVLPADVYYRYLRMKGEDAIFICGSDQHGTPIELAAVRKNVEPAVLADEMHETLKSLYAKYDCAFTHYGKTHTQENKEVVYDFFEALHKNGYIMESEDMQAYCNIDKRFLPDRFIQGTCPYCKTQNARGDQCNNCDRLLEPTQIIDPFCAVCGKKDIKFVKSKNLAIELNKFEKQLTEFITKNGGNNWSKDAVNKSLSSIKEGLRPRDITRNMKWGFPVPLPGYENAVFYVWFDAVLGYIGITKEWDERKWKDYWQGKDTRLVHFLGKDNTIFHTIMWPAMLMGSDLGFVLPHTIKESQFLLSNTFKFSKSNKVGLDMSNAVDIMPSDFWRFTLMYLYPETADTELSEEALTETVNTIMNDKIGNFAQRVLKLAKSNSPLIAKDIRFGGEERAAKAIEHYDDAFSKLQIRKAISAAVELAEIGNEIMSKREPWLLAKKAKDDAEAAKELSGIFSDLIAITYALAIALHPFTPKASRELLKYFGITSDPTLGMLKDPINVDLSMEPTPLFHKIGKDEIEKLRKFS